LWQLKLPHSGQANARTELEEPGGPSGPPPSLARLLVALTRHGGLGPVATLRTKRSGVRVRDGLRPVAEVTVDEVTILAGAKTDGFTELEVELVETGHDDDLSSLAEVLRTAGARPGAETPKVMRVLDLPPPPELDAKAPLGVQLHYLLGAQLDEIERHDPGVRLGGDPEDVHRMRVATRRSRALIRAARSLLGDRFEESSGELKLLGGVLGAVRDLDVLLERLDAEVASLDGDEDAARELLAALSSEREQRRAELLEALESSRYFALLDAFRRDLDQLDLLETKETAADLARRALKKLRQAADDLPRNPSDEQLHALRIKAKRARYAAELAALGGGKKATRTVDAFKRLQDLIGDHQDAVVAEEKLRQITQTGTALASGRLIELERERKAEMREQYPAALRAALREGRKAFG
jgi:CHAD domain-containing protein